MYYIIFCSIHLTDAFHFLLYFSLLCLFCTDLTFYPHLFLHLVYPYMWCSMLSLMARLVVLLVVTEVLCEMVLAFTILVWKPNKLFRIITQTIKSLHGLYCMVFKSMYFWCDTRSKIAPGLPGSRNKNPASLIFLLRLDLIRFVISVGELSNTDYLLVLR